MPLGLRIVLVVACLGIGSVVVRHITQALQLQPIAREAEAR